MQRTLALLLLIVIPTGVRGLAYADPDEPTYRGRTASVWQALLQAPWKSETIETLVDGETKALPVLVWVIQHQEVGAISFPEGAYEALERMGPVAGGVLPTLLERYRLGHFDASYRLVDAMVAVDPESEDLVKTLRWGLRHEYSWVQNSAAVGLAKLGEHDKKAIAILLEVIPFSREYDLMRACLALGEIGPDAGQAIPKLEYLTTHRDAGVRICAFAAYLKLGKKAEARVPRMLGKSSPEIQIYAAIWLGSRGEESKKAVKSLCKTLREGREEEVRAAMALGIGLIGPAASTAAGDLRDALEDDSELVRKAAATALLRIGEKGVTKLRHALNSREPRAVEVASEALALLESDEDLVVRDLVIALGRRRSAKPAAEALGRMGKRAVPALIKGLGSNRAEMRRWCAFALGHIPGDEAKEAIPALEKCMKDENDEVREEARRALHYIRME